MHLENILRQPADSPNVLFRYEPFGANHREELIRAVLGLANAAIDAKQDRYIIIGVHHADGGTKNVVGLTDSDFDTLAEDISHVRRYVEPELELAEIHGESDGQPVAVIELKNCLNPPYIVKADLSEKLRRGECWIRKNGEIGPASRADFDRMYGRAGAPKKAPVSQPQQVVVGFNGQLDCLILNVIVPDILKLPSQVAKEKLKKAIEAKRSAKELFGGTDTGIARLIHTRLHGVETPFVSEGLNTMVEGYNTGEDDRRKADLHYLYEQNAIKINLVVANKAKSALADAVLELTLPRAPGFDVVDYIHAAPGKTLSPEEIELMGYPEIKKTPVATTVTQALGTLEPGRPAEIFETPLRLAVDIAMRGMKVALRYTITAPGLKEPATGRLKIQFAA